MPIKAPLLFLLLTLALLVAMAWALGAGSIARLGELAGAVARASSEGLLICSCRCRLLAAACCGALLALAGALMQLLLRNPLADPAVLGISAGASFCSDGPGLGVGRGGLSTGFAGALVANPGIGAG